MAPGQATILQSPIIRMNSCRKSKNYLIGQNIKTYKLTRILSALRLYAKGGFVSGRTSFPAWWVSKSNEKGFRQPGVLKLLELGRLVMG